MIGLLFDMFTGVILIFSSIKFLDMCKLSSGWPTSIEILWKWDSNPTELAENGECRLTWFHPSRNFFAKKIDHFSRLSHQTGCLYTCAAHSI